MAMLERIEFDTVQTESNTKQLLKAFKGLSFTDIRSLLGTSLPGLGNATLWIEPSSNMLKFGYQIDGENVMCVRANIDDGVTGQKDAGLNNNFVKIESVDPVSKRAIRMLYKPMDAYMPDNFSLSLVGFIPDKDALTYYEGYIQKPSYMDFPKNVESLPSSSGMVNIELLPAYAEAAVQKLVDEKLDTIVLITSPQNGITAITISEDNPFFKNGFALKMPSNIGISATTLQPAMQMVANLARK